MIEGRDLERRGAGANGQPARRVVLLGASNLARGISTVLETARHVWGRPLEVFTALGHGRSYGKNSTVMWRELPGITECGLWDALGSANRVPTAALLTDIGNDLLYGAMPEQIAGWVAQCVDRLAAVEARTVVTLLPVGNLTALSGWRFLLLRTISYPNCRLTLGTVTHRAFELNERVRELAAARGIPVVEQRSEWYGFDPVHIKLSSCSDAWRDILRAWSDTLEPPAGVRASLAASLYLLSHTPHHRRVLGFVQGKEQPSGRLSDGTVLSIY